MGKRFGVLLLAAGVAAAACDVRTGEQGVSVGVARGKAADEWVKRYPMPPGTELEIINVNGPIDVTRAEGSEAEVRISREAEAGSDEAAAAALERVEIAEQASEGRVRVEIKRPERDGFGFGRGRVRVSYRVRVPDNAAASFRTENGPIRIEGVTGRFSAATANGLIDAVSLSGGMTASTVNGGLHLAFTKVEAPVTATTVNGQIRLELPAGVNADLEASVVNGNISVDDSFGFSSTAGSVRTPGVNRLEGPFGAGGVPISLQVTNGSVRIAPAAGGTSR